MHTNNIIRDKSFEFACKIVGCCRALIEAQKAYVLSKQLLRSGTAIGALVRESVYAESKADFIHKLSVARKEANETAYWLDLLVKTHLITNEQYLSLSNEVSQLLKLLTSIIKTSKNKLVIDAQHRAERSEVSN